MEIYICNFKLGEKPLIAGVLTDADIPTINSDYLNAADLLELRVDMFENISPLHIEAVFKTVRDRLKKPIIATIRDVKEGGKQEIKDRLSVYRVVCPLSDVIDVELGSEDIFPKIKNLCEENKKVLIGSYHNYNLTPNGDFFDEIVIKGKEAGADIVKIATVANSSDDLIRLMLLNLRHREKGLITISMGDGGLPSRILNPLFGSLITYGYISHPSAPGQISVSELMYIFRRLRIRQK